jgi:hypothetical protein
MRKYRFSKKEELLRLFVRGAQENDCYTGQDLCRKVGIPYEQVLRWARDDYRWRDALEMVASRCLTNVEIATMMKRMPLKQALKYMDYRNMN